MSYQDIPRSCWRDCISLPVWDPLRAGRGDPGRKGLDFSAQYMCLCLDSCPTTQTQIHGRKWMDELVKNCGKMLLDLLQYRHHCFKVQFNFLMMEYFTCHSVTHRDGKRWFKPAPSEICKGKMLNPYWDCGQRF